MTRGQPNPHTHGTPEHMLHQMRLNGLHIWAEIVERMMKQIESAKGGS